MLVSSDFTITLNQSKDYLRIAILLHGLAVIAIIDSSLPLFIKMGALFFVAIFMLKIVRSRVPLPLYHKISYQKNQPCWLLHQLNGQYQQYEKASINFEGGLFMILTLSGNHPRKNLVIFYDQMSPEERRILKVMGQRG